MSDLCGSRESHRVHTPVTRLLRCSECGRVWPWGETGDGLPPHEAETNPISLADLKKGVTA